ncbi:unnamed protein product [Phytomonas sp. EM1]|nr:unnamed protein product [Phytomonas sp. EM1]|eukprot:CCW65077.1 unnamed protein product [Phytomonas sp. isolate EM1]
MALSRTSCSLKPRQSSGSQESVGKTSSKIKSSRARQGLKTKTNKPVSRGTSAQRNSGIRKGASTAYQSEKPEEESNQKLETAPKEEVASHKNEDDDINNDDTTDSLRPAYMSEELEKKVLSMAERMQVRDISGEVPVASFAYEILKTHPSVRKMGLRERMHFLCRRWEALSEKERLSYLNHPLKGLL